MPQRRIRRIGYAICMLLVLSGIVLFILKVNNILAAFVVIGGFFGLIGVLNADRMMRRSTRANRVDIDRKMW